MPLSQAVHVPTATYRFQLNPQFTFFQLRDLVPYLDDLGISDAYFSPIFRAAPGSTHGYDVSDLTLLNPELGGDAGFREATDALRGRGMGCLLDFVPNHMGVAGSFNHWWRDVLENGRNSRYCRYFDIEWNPRHEALRGRILVPILGDYYGRVLEMGELKLELNEGRFSIRYHESLFPLRPHSTARLLDGIDLTASASNGGRVAGVRSLFQLLPEPGPVGEAQDYAARKELLAQARRELVLLVRDPALEAALRQVLAAYQGRPGDAASFDRLHELLEEQNYRLAYWKMGAHETNYRRFFAVDTLVGIRVEDGIVLQASHKRLAELVREGRVRGVRLDHIDGLWDPERYLNDFQSLVGESASPKTPLYTLVEKILEHGEEPPEAWPIHGTTGYEFISQLAGALVDGRAGDCLSETFADFTGIRGSAADLIYGKKIFVIEELFANAVGNLALGLDQIVDHDRRWRDLTMHDLRVAVREFMACLNVYRTYRRPGRRAGPRDAAVVEAACREAKRRNRCLDPVPFDFVRDVLLGDYVETPAARQANLFADVWALKFQQATGAVMAKSVEDTAFFVFNRLYALNEVGCDPGRLGAPLDEFHALNRERAAKSPQSMTTTSTHDTKMSEDVRARLYALSERPDEWRRRLAEWARHNRPAKTAMEEGRTAPDANEEFLLYQILLGAWPPGAKEAPAGFADRIKGSFRKAINEAKTNSTWVHLNEAWLRASDRFVERLLDPAHGFLPLFLPEAEIVASHGMVNSLAQLVLKAASPGVPDFYQGNEVWDFSLVDPDNRRPVDYAARRELLAGLGRRSPEQLLAQWPDGGIKLHVTRALLRFRRAHPALFQQGDYQPVAATGKGAEHVVAFTRAAGNERLLVVAPRLPGRIGLPPVGATWGDTRLALDLPGQGWIDLLTGGSLRERRNPAVADLLAVLPCAVFALA